HNPDTQVAKEMVATLLSRGAIMTARAAVFHGDAGWIRARHAEGKLETELPPLQGERGLLEVAVRHRRKDILDLLLQLGLDPDERHRVAENRYSWGAPLRACVKHTDLDVARLLLDRGADPNGQDSYYGSPVYTAYCDKSAARNNQGQNNQAMIALLESRG